MVRKQVTVLQLRTKRFVPSVESEASEVVCGTCLSFSAYLPPTTSIAANRVVDALPISADMCCTLSVFCEIATRKVARFEVMSARHLAQII